MQFMFVVIFWSRFDDHNSLLKMCEVYEVTVRSCATKSKQQLFQEHLVSERRVILYAGL